MKPLQRSLTVRMREIALTCCMLHLFFLKPKSLIFEFEFHRNWNAYMASLIIKELDAFLVEICQTLNPYLSSCAYRIVHDPLFCGLKHWSLISTWSGMTKYWKIYWQIKKCVLPMCEMSHAACHTSFKQRKYLCSLHPICITKYKYKKMVLLWIRRSICLYSLCLLP